MDPVKTRPEPGGGGNWQMAVHERLVAVLGYVGSTASVHAHRHTQTWTRPQWVLLEADGSVDDGEKEGNSEVKRECEECEGTSLANSVARRLRPAVGLGQWPVDGAVTTTAEMP